MLAPPVCPKGRPVKTKLLICFALCAVGLSVCLAACTPADITSHEASTSDIADAASPEKTSPAILTDGDYEIEVTTDSRMFRPTACTLHIQDGSYTATITMPGKGFSRLYYGTVEEAEAANDASIYEYDTNAEGKYTFDLDVPALNEELTIAAWGQRRDRWYPHTITFFSPVEGAQASADSSGSEESVAPNSSDAPKNPNSTTVGPGTTASTEAEQIAVSLEGGTGKATILSPVTLSTEDDQSYAHFVWSSSNYDLMIVDGVEYRPVSLEPGSTFIIPIEPDQHDLEIQAQTTAMSEPHLITYTVHFGVEAPRSSANMAADAGAAQIANFRNTDLGNGLQATGEIKLDYARCFSLDTYEGGYTLACISNGGRYLIVPEAAEVPEGLANDIVVLKQPISDVYLVASDTGCLIEALDVVGSVTVSGIKAEDWHVDSIRKAMDAGNIIYGGKYNMPDYEVLLGKGVRLAIESTMINHTPDVREKLIELGIPVLTEMSSYEDEPLGRAEWVKLYGALFNKSEEASEKFAEQVKTVDGIESKATGKTVAFFYINSNGNAVIRRPGDYTSTMIEQAGGSYIFDSLAAEADPDDMSNMSSMTLEMEKFFATAKDADIIIYNASIDNSINSIDDLVKKNEVLGKFKAIQEGQVWKTKQNVYQQMMNTGAIIADFNKVFNGSTEDLSYLEKLS